jgi:hypothetical protein
MKIAPLTVGIVWPNYFYNVKGKYNMKMYENNHSRQMLLSGQAVLKNKSALQFIGMSDLFLFNKIYLRYITYGKIIVWRPFPRVKS